MLLHVKVKKIWYEYPRTTLRVLEEDPHKSKKPIKRQQLLTRKIDEPSVSLQGINGLPRPTLRMVDLRSICPFSEKNHEQKRRGINGLMFHQWLSWFCVCKLVVDLQKPRVVRYIPPLDI